ncbi:UDP-glucose 4-epimerase GalE [Candidatus Daviesbacteria bacterium RIFCSPLOWO2_01_FULL_43_38]|uniref:UDP-glucose 4-epimerase n=2 Tax=Candidatus Daviesiibacteriota TaxID=1752718 RepID=A0A1F5K6A8_9BACT|nr:MAG: UDP-galactose 4-epimerase [Candidatus Daviesbacteria bacterium GW2011_GWA2_42_7]OGE36439.1 MAG: UDP-glucose 4-epimerase GalE [Candidatus Daviesbacteria bacterium RIFCSPHIGHO2_12_FULL_43_11]OGE63187.1 MAG: UDP-glucose 4-epimerase GalE [Candidatus Daviesbacteria bacterium RIFCSPLOWO2_01_FULL_43_38]
MGKKILITGAGGYIGSVTTYLFLQNGFEVVAIDNFSTGYKKPLEVLQKKFGQAKLRYYEVNLADDLSQVFDAEKEIVAAVHFAANCLVDESMRNPQKYFSNNVCGSQNLLVTLLAQGIDKVVFSSTCAVYGEAEYVPIGEDHPTNPANPYGASKRIVEQIIEWYGKQSGLNYVILRYFNVCGASEDGLIGDSKKPSVLLMQNAVRGALGIGPFQLTCPTVDTPDKTPIRDYINVVDLANAHLKAVNYLLGGGKSEIINLGTGTGNSVLEIVSRVQEVTGEKISMGKTTPREGEYAKMIASIKKAKRVLGWQPERSIADSINSLASWYKKHPHGWEG